NPSEPFRGNSGQWLPDWWRQIILSGIRNQYHSAVPRLPGQPGEMRKTMRLEVRDLVGELAITLEDGQRVYDRMVPALANGQPVELDFAGVTVFAAPFFNAAVGQLLRDVRAEDVRNLLSRA